MDEVDWGDEDDDNIFGAISELDYKNEAAGTTTTVRNGKSSSTDWIETNIPLPTTSRKQPDESNEELATFQWRQNNLHLNEQVLALNKKLDEHVRINSDLKSSNYSLQGEATTLRRKLEQQNHNRQKEICQRIEAIQGAKQQETEEKKKLHQEIESLKSQLRLSHINVQNLEDRNKKLTKCTTLGRPSTSNPAITISNEAQSVVPLQRGISQAFSTIMNSPMKAGKLTIPTRQSFFSKEIPFRFPSPVPPLMETKEVQTEAYFSQPIPVTDTDEKELPPTDQLYSSPYVYKNIKESTRRIITIEIQLLQPVVAKTLKYASVAFKRKLNHKKPRFGLGLEAFDSTALMLQWMDEKEMDEFDESEDLQPDYFRRLIKMYNNLEKGSPPIEDDQNDSEIWEDSENLVGSDEDKDIHNEQSQQSSDCDSHHSDTSEDEYDLDSCNFYPFDPTQPFDLTQSGNQGVSNTSGFPIRKPLTFLKDYKFKSRLLTHRNNFKYLKDGQPLEVVVEALEGVYENGGVWNTLYYVKNELKFILERELFQSNRLHVFTTLLIWAKNLWTIVSAVEIQEKEKLLKIWDKELFGWTEILIRIVWRPTKSLVDFCRELRIHFLHTITMIIKAGYFDESKENYRRLYLTLLNTIQSTTHHSFENAALILDICTGLPRSKISKYFCRQTISDGFLKRKCFLQGLSDRVASEFNRTSSLSLFHRYINLLNKLANSIPEINSKSTTMSTQSSKKRKLDEGEEEMDNLEESPDLVNVDIFSHPSKCDCMTNYIYNFLLMLSQIWKQWSEMHWEMEFRKYRIKREIGTFTTTNSFTDALLQSFEILCKIFKCTENIRLTFGTKVFTSFWESIASYKRFEKYINLRPDMHSMLTRMSHDEEDERQRDLRGITFPSILESEWTQLVNDFPELMAEPVVESPPVEIIDESDEDKEN